MKGNIKEKMEMVIWTIVSRFGPLKGLCMVVALRIGSLTSLVLDGFGSRRFSEG